MSEATSTFTFRALVEALKYISPRQTVLLRGRHGIGKSAIAYKMAKVWGLDTIIERRISQLSEGDMIGLPDRGATKEFNGVKWDVTRFLPTDWFLEAEFKPCLVFLDEINRGTPETMQACFQFIEKGELNGRRIHPDSRIIAAINFSKEYQVTPMDPAFNDRFWVADVDPDKDDWLAWARQPVAEGGGGLSDDIIDFIVQCNDDHFEIKPEKLAQLPAHERAPSRRSWERLARHFEREVNGVKLIENSGLPAAYDLARGFVGPDAARAFVKFQLDRNQNVTPTDVLDDFKKNVKRIKKLKPEQSVALIDKIKHYIESKKITLTDEQATNMGAFMEALSPELAITLWNTVASGSPENVKIFHSKVHKYFMSIITQTKVGAQLAEYKKNKQ